MNKSVTVDAHFCEVMYCHYAERIRECKNPVMRIFLQANQMYYLNKHEQLVPFQNVVANIPSIIFN